MERAVGGNFIAEREAGFSIRKKLLLLRRVALEKALRAEAARGCLDGE
jgi:hypothetical protein